MELTSFLCVATVWLLPACPRMGGEVREGWFCVSVYCGMGVSLAGDYKQQPPLSLRDISPKYDELDIVCGFRVGCVGFRGELILGMME